MLIKRRRVSCLDALIMYQLNFQLSLQAVYLCMSAMDFAEYNLVPQKMNLCVIKSPLSFPLILPLKQMLSIYSPCTCFLLQGMRKTVASRRVLDICFVLYNF